MLNIVKNKDLSTMNTFRLRCNCNTYVEYDSVADFFEIDFEELPRPFIQLGNGSNLLLTKDIEGTVFHSKIDFIEIIDEENLLVSVGAGLEFDKFCEWASEQGYWGVENLSHIPGQVGASVVQNLGAYGVEIKDVLKYAYCFDIEAEEFFQVSNADCDFDYRYSAFKHPEVKGKHIITHVVFQLSKDPKPRLDYGHLKAKVDEREEELTPALIRKVVTEIRMEKLPEVSELGSVGSFFTNPIVEVEKFAEIEAIAQTSVPHYVLDGGLVKIPAAWFIENCGWKGCQDGNVAVYEKQPLVLVNATGKARPREVIALAAKIANSINDKYGILLEPEVEIL